VECFSSYAFCLGFCAPAEPNRSTPRIAEHGGIAKIESFDAETQKGCGMTSLRLFETDAASIAVDTTVSLSGDNTLSLSGDKRLSLSGDKTSHLFETPPGARYQRSRRGYDASVVLHAIALVALVVLARRVTPPPPAPAPPVRDVTSTFVFTKFDVDNRRPRRPAQTQRAKRVPAAIVAEVATAPVRSAPAEPRVADTPAIEDEKPVKSAFDPPIPAGDARLQGRRGDPREAGLGSATINVRGSPTTETRAGGLGDGSVRGVSTGGAPFSVRPGFGDDSEGGGGATPPRIQGPLPIPDYPTDARTRRLQGVVALEVMLDSSGKARVRRVLSYPLGFGIEDAARNAAERLKFTPARKGGRPVDAIVQVRVTFTLTGGVSTAVMGGA
jgi:TonB family protein